MQEILNAGVTLERVNKIRHIANLYANACIRSECSLCCLLEQIEGIKIVWEKIDDFGANEQQALILMRELDVGQILTIFTRKPQNLIPIFAAFHELGHYCLNHYVEDNAAFGGHTDVQEVEASYFSFVILAIAQNQAFDNMPTKNFATALKSIAPVFFPFISAKYFFEEEISHLNA